MVLLAGSKKWIYNSHLEIIGNIDTYFLKKMYVLYKYYALLYEYIFNYYKLFVVYCCFYFVLQPNGAKKK